MGEREREEGTHDEDEDDGEEKGNGRGGVRIRRRRPASERGESIRTNKARSTSLGDSVDVVVVAAASVDWIPRKESTPETQTPGFFGNPVTYRVDGIPDRSRLLRLRLLVFSGVPSSLVAASQLATTKRTRKFGETCTATDRTNERTSASSTDRRDRPLADFVPHFRRTGA